MDINFIRPLIALGIPGVALGIFYLLMKPQSFEFSKIDPTWSAIIVLCFLIITGAVTLYALHRWAPKTKSNDLPVRKKPQWTPYERFVSHNFPNLEQPLLVKLQFELHADDPTIPLLIRVASTVNGNCPNTATGPAAVVEQLIEEPSTFYVSLSHPSIKYTCQTLGWTEPR
ncbi:hypothetical protein [Pseudomonas peli]|uniref:hypothetical protein n=1 Tax=Pseudomonas peli TaxID=592361 RepID=UPI002856F02D|nr:hypothetical protein [Pseudomonas peli]MDR7024234.1 hypothetical protein [Pseudomonas peli]